MNNITNKLKLAIKLGLASMAATTSLNAFAADYPANIDYGTKGDFVSKRGVEFGRTAILMPVGPILINLPETPGSSTNQLDQLGLDNVRYEDTAWDLSDLTNPTMIRSLTCDTCNPGQPIHAHATVVRFEDSGPTLYGRGEEGHLQFDPNGETSNDQLTSFGWSSWGYDPLGYTNQTSPYFTRTYWNYGFDPVGQFAIRDLSRQMESGPVRRWYVTGTEWEEIFGPTELGVWLGEPFVWWDHLGLTGVTGFTSWLGNLLVVASDQQSTGIAIYDVSGFKEGRVPRLLSTYKPELTEPSGNKVGVGGYWVEPYGTNKMVYAARALNGSPVKRDYPGMFVIDFTDPTEPELSCAIYFDQDKNDDRDGDGSSDPMYVNFQDQYAFVDHFKVDIPACEAAFDDEHISTEEFHEIVYKFNDIANECEASQFFRPLGQVGIFGGYDWWVTPDVNEQGMCFMVTDDEPDSTKPIIAGHQPLSGQTGIPIDTFIHIHIPETLRTETVEHAIQVNNILTNEAVDVRMQLSQTGIISLWPDEYLDASTSYRVSLSGIQDFMGNTMDDYSFTFTTNEGDLINGHGPFGGEQEQEPETGPAPSYEGTAYYPNQSSQLACDTTQVDGNVWAVNPDNDSVSIITPQRDGETQVVKTQLTAEIKLAYQAPTSVTKLPDSYAVTHRDDDKVVFYSNQGHALFAIDTGHGSQPTASVFDGTSLYVSLYASGEVIKIDVENRKISSRLNVGSTPKAMSLTGQRLLVSRFISPSQHAEVYDINTNANMSLTRTITINKVTVADDIDHGTGVPNYLSSIVIDDSNERAYITATKANTDRGLARNGQPLDSDNTVRPMIAIIDLVNNRDLNQEPSTRQGTLDLDNGADPSAVTFLPNPAIRAHALQGNNVITLNNLANNTTGQFGTGFAPQGMCTTLRTLYVKNFTDRSVSAIDIAGFMHDGRLVQEIATTETVTEETLSNDELAGLKTFYHSSMPEMGTEGYISCASCHAGSGQDGRVWDLSNMDEGLRNTLSLNGISGTRFGNLHWSSNFDEVQDFEVQMENLNGGTGLVEGKTFNGQSPLDFTSTGLSDRLDQLAAYVDGLGKDRVKRSPYRTYTGQLTKAAQRGQALFNQANCQSCHSGKAFRDGLNHDVGTIKSSSGQRLGSTLSAIRTPSLIELWDSAPYFHDGSAETIEQVLNTGSHQTELNPNQVSDLIEYLFSIDRKEYIDDDADFNLPEQPAVELPLPANDDWTEKNYARILFSGHSLTDASVPTVRSLAEQNTLDVDSFYQSIPGSPMRVRTRGNTPSNDNSWQGYSAGTNGLNLINEIRNPSLFDNNAPFDTLVITERNDLLSTIEWESTVSLLRHYHDLMLDGNPKAKTYFYHSWFGIDKSNPAPWIQYEKDMLMTWECVSSKVNLTLENDGLTGNVDTIGTGWALAHMVEAALNGDITGISGSQQQILDQIFSDDVHLTATGMVFSGAFTYSEVFAQSAQGSPTPTGVNENTAEALRELAWQLAQQYHQRADSGAHDMASCREHIADNVCEPFNVFRDRPELSANCQNHFSSETSGHPFVWPDNNLKTWPRP